jgi:hypothetical protein
MLKLNRRMRVVGLFVLPILLCTGSARAWIDTGHKIVAQIAWEELAPQTRAKVIQLLRAHPRYEKDLVEDPAAATAPTSGSADADDVTVDPLPDAADRHVFSTAATWPDIVRVQGHPMHAAYHHPTWHYIDIPVVIGNLPVPADKSADGPPPHNIVEALQKSIADATDSKLSDGDRAIALCWVEHLVGDIHQPLHAAMLVSQQFPEGDRGGNAITILRDPPYPDSRINLHLFWDELPGQFKSDDLDRYEADGIRNDPRFSRERFNKELRVNDIMTWAKQSQALAARYAYLNGNLKGASSKDVRSDPRGEIPGLPPGYVAQAERVAMRQVALAGHRLADVLNTMFGAK